MALYKSVYHSSSSSSSSYYYYYYYTAQRSRGNELAARGLCVMEIAVVRWFAACALCRATSRALHKTGDYIYQRFANLQQSNKMITLFDVTIGRTHAFSFFRTKSE